jgi:hypothetical protein
MLLRAVSSSGHSFLCPSHPALQHPGLLLPLQKPQRAGLRREGALGSGNKMQT